MNTTNTNTKKQVSTVKSIVTTAVMAAVVCAIALIPSIPTQPVAVTMQLIGVFLAPLLLGWKGAAAVGIYILIGAAGIPVFSKYTGGIGVILGPSGGYIIGFFAASLIIAFVRQRTDRFLPLLFATLFSLIPVYALGVIQLSVVLKLDLFEAFMAGVPSFILLDIVKAIVAVLLAQTIQKRVNHFL